MEPHSDGQKLPCWIKVHWFPLLLSALLDDGPWHYSTTWTGHCPLALKQHRYLNQYQQHREFPSSLPSKYWPFPCSLTSVFKWELVHPTWHGRWLVGWNLLDFVEKKISKSFLYYFQEFDLSLELPSSVSTRRTKPSFVAPALPLEKSLKEQIRWMPSLDWLIRKV